MRTLLVVLLSAAGVFIGGMPAHSTGGRHAGWLTPSVLSGAGARGPRVAVDARGDVTVAWGTKDGTDQGVVEAAVRPAGGSFEAAQDVSAAGLWAGPDLGVDRAGNATVVWASGDPPNVVVRVATRTTGRRFGLAQNLGGPDTIVSSPRIAVDARGDAVAMWLASDDPISSTSSYAYVLRAAFRLAGGRYGPAENVLAFPADPQVPSYRFASDAKGDAVVVALSSHFPRSFVRVAYRPSGGKFGASTTLAEASGQTGPNGQLAYVDHVDAAIDTRGAAVATWWNSGRIQAAFRPAAGGAWQSPRDLGRPGACCTGPAIGVDARGNAVVAWVVSRAGTVQASTLAAGSGHWRTPQTLSRPGDRALSEAPSVAVGAHGDVVVAWAATRSPAAVVAAVRPRGGSFAPAQDVWHGPGFASVGLPQVAVDPQGNATALWGTTPSPLPRDSHSGYIQAAGYDAAGPQLRSLRLPVSARVGGVLHLSVAPLDVWSGVSSTRWSFGDGAHAVGQHLQHTYRHPGRYDVIVTSTDGLGNATRARRTVHVVPR
jgi:hypothetical protein